jgi:hypothetical protein
MRERVGVLVLGSKQTECSQRSSTPLLEGVDVFVLDRSGFRLFFMHRAKMTTVIGAVLVYCSI